MVRKILFFAIAIPILITLGLNSVQKTEIQETVEKIVANNVPLGYIVTTSAGLPNDEFLVRLAEKEINEYCLSNNISWRFHYNITCAEGQAQKAHDHTQEFADNGIKLVGGYGWSSFLCSGARKIAQENNMTLISISSTSPIMAIPDSAFRLCPTDLHQIKPLIKVITDFEFSSVIIIQRGDAWGDGIVKEFESNYDGKIVKTIRYPPESIEFRNYLAEAETAYIEYNNTLKPCVLLISFSEASYILNEAQFYPNLLNTSWFGTDSTADEKIILEEAGEYASKVNLISPKITVNQNNTDYQKVNQHYKERFDNDMDFYQANVYDCCWLMAHCIIDLNTTNGASIRSNIIEVASNHQGITGELSLDPNGDREIVTYAYYGYFEVNNTYVSNICGLYHEEKGQIIWKNE
jgi:ABC-type branched-subunit amino acid transport system substrate-binding protein